MMRAARILLAIAASASLVGCAPHAASSKPKAEPPAKVEKLPQETEIAQITLTAAAEQRLGITLAAVAKENVERRRTFGGEVMIPTGKSIIVSAPVPGTITAPASGSIPLPGRRVEVGEPVLTLVPLLSPERDVPTPAERVQMANARATLLSALTVAQGDVERSQAEVEAARIALDRAEKLLADKAGSAKAVDDVRAQLNIAETNLHAAQQREQQFARLAIDLEATGSDSQATPLVMTSPQSGVFRNLSVSRGQTVNSGTALFEVVNTATMWVRVPIYVDLLPDIRTDADTRIVGLDGRTVSPPRLAQHVAAPPSADPLSTTADLYFETSNRDATLRPGQRVGVELPMRGDREGLVVPAKAILYDIFGGTWVYEKTGDHVFQRHRVLVNYTQDDHAILEEGPIEGTEVVVDGVAELFGTEFGSGK